MKSNYHSHSDYCDGSHSLDVYVMEAIQQGFKSYGFSSHAPIPFDCKWTMNKCAAKDYLRNINYLKNKWKGLIQLYASMEVDFIPGYAGVNSPFIKNLALDYTIGSVHFVDFVDEGILWEIDGNNNRFELGLERIFKGDIELAVKRYYALIRQMVYEETPTIVGHLDKIKIQNSRKDYFKEEDSWYQNAVEETLLAIQNSGAFLEVNTRGYYKGKTHDFYPSNWILKRVKELNIPIVLNSDAHQPTEISAGYYMAMEALREIGIQSSMQFNGTEWEEFALDILVNVQK